MNMGSKKGKTLYFLEKLDIEMLLNAVDHFLDLPMLFKTISCITNDIKLS